MLKVLRREGRVTPLICCDVCGAWIDDAEFGAVVYPHLDFLEGSTQDVQIVHKGACHDAAEAKLATAETGVAWLELKSWLADAVHNSGVTPGKIAEMRADEDKFGRL
jgi:hypothetical protein